MIHHKQNFSKFESSGKDAIQIQINIMTFSSSHLVPYFCAYDFPTRTFQYLLRIGWTAEYF